MLIDPLGTVQFDGSRTNKSGGGTQEIFCAGFALGQLDCQTIPIFTMIDRRTAKSKTCPNVMVTNAENDEQQCGTKRQINSEMGRADWQCYLGC